MSVAPSTTTRTTWLDLLGAEVRYYDAGGIRTRAIEAGAGEPLVLLHGVGGHAETYQRNVVPLAEGGYHVYAIDFVGHGFSDKPDQDYGVSVFADHVLRFLDAIGAERAHLSGESLGGWTAAWLALQRPERVGKVILNTAAGLAIADQSPTLAAEYQERRKELRERTLAALDNPSRETVRKRLEWLMADPASVTEELLETRYRIYAQPEFRQAQRRYWSRDVSLQGDTELLTRERLQRITAPTFFLWTEHDPFLPWQVAEQAHQLVRGSRFHVMRNCGHWPQFEDPDEFNRLSLDFLHNG
jgi:2-hydroxy-6-oxo-6-(2'-carboxyphenyl)-hexa-2,4-dienoate hydrolase